MVMDEEACHHGGSEFDGEDTAALELGKFLSDKRDIIPCWGRYQSDDGDFTSELEKFLSDDRNDTHYVN